MLREALASAFLKEAIPKGLNFAFVEQLGWSMMKGISGQEVFGGALKARAHIFWGMELLLMFCNIGWCTNHTLFV